MVSQIVPKTGLLYETPINRMLIGRVVEWSKAADHKSVDVFFGGSNLASLGP